MVGPLRPECLVVGQALEAGAFQEARKALAAAASDCAGLGDEAILQEISLLRRRVDTEEDQLLAPPPTPSPATPPPSEIAIPASAKPLPPPPVTPEAYTPHVQSFHSRVRSPPLPSQEGTI